MSETERSSESPSSEAPLISGKPSPLIVRLILFAALALLVAAAGYEYLYARAQSEGALRKLEELDQRKTDLAEPLYDEEVQKLIGFEPEREKIDHLTVIDYYRWQSVIPNRQYYLWVLYRLTYDNRWQCDAYGANKEPELDKHSPIGSGGPSILPPPAGPAGRMPQGGLPRSLPGDSPPVGPPPSDSGS
jgi:hypothetical protein